MTIIFPSDPGIGFSKFTLALKRKSLVGISPYTGNQQAQGLTYALWAVNCTLDTIDSLSYPVAAGKMRSFLAKLQGQAQVFQLTIPWLLNSTAGYIGPTGVVNGGGQTGDALATSGWSPNTAICLEGDLFTVNGEFKISTAAIESDGSGDAEIPFLPTLRSVPPDGSYVYFDTPFLTLAADKDDVASWDISSPILQDISFTALERF